MKTSLKLIESFGDRYIDEYISPWRNKRDRLNTDWFQALDFFLSHVYYQGRNDELSTRFYEGAKKALLSYFGKGVSMQFKNYTDAWEDKIIPHDPNWKIWKKNNNALLTELERLKAGKTRDIQMVIDILRFIHGCPSNNIVFYTVNEIERGRIKKLYSEIDDIWQIGQKVTSFYLRDLIFCYELEILSDAYFAIMPIDTWVKQVAIRTGISSEKDSNPVVMEKFLNACNEEKVDPKKVNAGAWYLGANAFHILLDIINGETTI